MVVGANNYSPLRVQEPGNGYPPRLIDKMQKHIVPDSLCLIRPATVKCSRGEWHSSLLLGTQDFNGMIVRVICKVGVESKNSRKFKHIDYCKTGAVSVAEPFIVIMLKYFFCGFLDNLRYTQNYKVAFGCGIHEFDGGSMASSCFQKSICLIKHIIGCVKNCFVLRKCFVL